MNQYMQLNIKVHAFSLEWNFNFSFTREIYSGDEDCLYLNIFVPNNETVFEKNNFPVMFWIHGGANIYGAGSDYDFSKLATSQQVIIVTMNYRLGYLVGLLQTFKRNIRRIR